MRHEAYDSIEVTNCVTGSITVFCELYTIHCDMHRNVYIYDVNREYEYRFVNEMFSSKREREN